jgi:hypothetical protein
MTASHHPFLAKPATLTPTQMLAITVNETDPPSTRRRARSARLDDSLRTGFNDPSTWEA